VTGSELLKITKPEDLFPGDVDKAKQVYRALVRVWHPDLGGKTEVFAHITNLYDQALDRLHRGLWEKSAILTFSTARTDLHVSIRASSPFILGQSLVGDDHATYIINEAQTRIGEQAVKWPKLFKYDNPKMQEEFARYLPREIHAYQLIDGRTLQRIDKTPDLLRLRDVTTHLGGLKPKHLAWVVSRLLNLSCYLAHVGIVHQDISPDTVFISPEFHSAALLGGWWFAQPRGAKMTIIPRRTFDLLPFKAKVSKTTSALTDLELIRATAVECLTEPAPEPMNTWLRSVNGASPLQQFMDWMEVLEKTFGKRRFVKMEVTAEQVYGHNGKH
jgi:hypothetical protein